jgi:YidC/Oxa1 family membrane protein insertase
VVEPSSLDTQFSAVTDVVTQNVIPPLQYGDLANLGLIGWNPAGLIRWSLELIQVSTGMPWFWTIVAGTAFWRILMLPVSIKSTRNAALVAIHEPALLAARDEYNATFQKDHPGARDAAVKELQQAYRKAGVSPLLVFVPFLQLPVALGVFFGIRGMCDHPVQQLKQSGLDFLPDLTAITSAADPYFTLPILAVVLMDVGMRVCGIVRASVHG